jgi:hypothetical protein
MTMLGKNSHDAIFTLKNNKTKLSKYASDAAPTSVFPHVAGPSGMGVTTAAAPRIAMLARTRMRIRLMCDIALPVGMLLSFYRPSYIDLDLGSMIAMTVMSYETFRSPLAYSKFRWFH